MNCDLILGRAITIRPIHKNIKTLKKRKRSQQVIIEINFYIET